MSEKKEKKKARLYNHYIVTRLKVRTCLSHHSPSYIYIHISIFIYKAVFWVTRVVFLFLWMSHWCEVCVMTLSWTSVSVCLCVCVRWSWVDMRLPVYMCGSVFFWSLIWQSFSRVWFMSFGCHFSIFWYIYIYKSEVSKVAEMVKTTMKKKRFIEELNEMIERSYRCLCERYVKGLKWKKRTHKNIESYIQSEEFVKKRKNSRMRLTYPNRSENERLGLQWG